MQSSHPPRFGNLVLALLVAITVTNPAHPQNKAPRETFSVQGDHFDLNGRPFQILSGELHYTRIPRQYWRARLRIARAMGLNTIATYVFWNVHEPSPGAFDFTGNNDLAAFLRIAQQEHLHVLLRAGPYSCAEWEFGGFPAWLLKNPADAQALRTDDPRFMLPAERWINRLADEVKPLLLENGGPILAVQVENEYGNFGSDKKYLGHMLEIFQHSAFGHSLLYTVDPSKALANGSLPGILSGVNFGTGNAARGLSALAALRPGAPLFASEYWPGWFDLWGHPHETRPTAPQLEDLDYVLSRHGSINIYMFHGGTSFGFMNGASESTGSYRPNVTSYDYDAPLDEAGHTTPKFFAYRDLLARYATEPIPAPPATAPVIAIAPFPVTHTSPLWDHLPSPVLSPQPRTMESLGQSYGYILYRTPLPSATGTLVLDEVHDFAAIFLNGHPIGTLDRHLRQDRLTLNHPGPARLDILVENSGRLNSTRKMRGENKGITHTISLDGTPLTGWQIFSLPMPSAPPLSNKTGSPQGPHFASASFTLAHPGDTFLDIAALGKGVLWINGHALGRFWNIGPQRTLYIPGPWLRKGRNDLVLFDMLGTDQPPTLAGLTTPILDAPTPTYDNDPERKKRPAADAEFGPKLSPPASAPATQPSTPPKD